MCISLQLLKHLRKRERREAYAAAAVASALISSLFKPEVGDTLTLRHRATVTYVSKGQGI